MSITPCLWFNGNMGEAMDFYASVFPNSKIEVSSTYGASKPEAPDTPLAASFELDGQRFMAINADDTFKFTEAISFYIDCENQAEVDNYWDSLLANGGVPSQCGWLKDQFGLSWQVVPKQMQTMLTDPDKAKRDRVLSAMLQMVKIDLNILTKAYNNGI